MQNGIIQIKTFFKRPRESVADPDPVGSALICRIWIRKKYADADPDPDPTYIIELITRTKFQITKYVSYYC